MKMIKYYGILPLLFMLLVACNMEDKGNYDYISRDDFFPVKIAASFADDLEAMEFIPMEPAYYEPVFDEMDDYDRYTYSWYALYKDSKGMTARTDIAQTRILDVEQFPLNPGNYTIYFEVKDPEYDLLQLAKTSIAVQASQIGAFGVYIMKNEDGNTELDYYKFNMATNIPDKVPLYNNIVSSLFETPISGKPVAMERFNFTYDWEKVADDGTTSTSRVSGLWFILSENDIIATKTDFSIIYKQFPGHFYVQPDEVKPQILKPVRNSNFYFMNNNQIYGHYTMTMGVGRYPKIDRAGGVRASSLGMLSGSWYVLFYDEISSEFLYGYGYLGSVYSSATAQIKETTDLPNKEVVMNKLVEPIAIMDGGGMAPNATSGNINGNMILKHKTQPNTYYMTKSANVAGGVPFTWIRPIDAEADIVKTPYPVMSSSYIGDVIYYAKNGNELWYYADGGDTETPAPLSMRQLKAATLGAGETIVNITPAMYPYEGNYYFAWITVTTNTSDGHYKFYAFENNGATPELLPTPKLVLTGEGEAVCPYIYLSPQER